jgi:predicted restriction endonuclease
MNFRSLDPAESRTGLSRTATVDQFIWDRYFDRHAGQLDREKIKQDYDTVWGTIGQASVKTKPSYKDFGEAPNDNPSEVQEFARRVRKGQHKFRLNLRRIYDDKCAVAGWDPENVLEAAHIVEHAFSGLNENSNGLLLRSDLHALFDDGLLRVEPGTLRIVVDGSLAGTEYWQYHGHVLLSRCDGSVPSDELLAKRWEAHGTRKQT